MREFWMRLMSVVVIVGLILGYNSVLEVRAKDEEIAKLNAKIENVESLEDQESKMVLIKTGHIPEKRMDLVELLKWK